MLVPHVCCRAQAHRERRLAQQDAKRQKLRQELERKEKEGAKTRNEEEQARARLKVGACSRARETQDDMRAIMCVAVCLRVFLFSCWCAVLTG